MEKITISEKVLTPEDVKKELERKDKFPPLVDKKTKETFPPTKETLDKSKEERTKLSNEKLQSISNRDFLSISKERRLENITTNNVKSEKVADGTEKELKFTFTFDGKFNKELYLKTTAGQVLPKEVAVVKKDGKTYERNNLSGEFFTSGNSRLIIKEGTQINIEKTRTPEEIKKLEDTNNASIKSFKETKEYKTGFDDIISEAVKRGIDPKFAVLAFSEKIKNLAIMDISRPILIEEMFTEYDRIRSGITMWNGEKPKKGEKYPDEMVVRILMKFGGEEWKDKAKEYGIKVFEISRIQSLNMPKYLSLATRQEQISNAPEELKNLVKKYFPSSEYENALLVSYGESGFKSNAVNDKNRNGTIDRGYFQINSIHSGKYAGENIFDPEVNIRVASEIFREAGNTWRPWYAARKIGLA